ncbi:MAG: hypothetical protein JNM68_11460 [Dinghuibacter sp.]|nr:hypothetical protein [Dinghuibacter sp.]
MLFKTIPFLFLFGICTLFSAQAKIWRVNNNAGIAADFNNYSTAIASALVLNGDTLYLEASATGYSSGTLSKRLVVISNGYFLGGAGANPNLQANTNGTFFTSALSFDSLSAGSVFLGVGMNVDLWLDPRADNVTFERCRFNSISWNTQAASTANRAQNIIFNKCYFNGASTTPLFYYDNLQITNCIVNGSLNFASSNIGSALMRNNLFRGSALINIFNTYFANNIILDIVPGNFNPLNSTLKNNIAENNLLPVGNGNQNNITEASLFVGPTGNSTDGQWQLLPVTSPAIGAGETVGGITPDCGPFGTADPYRLSGIPPIPTIYSLTVPNNVGVGQPLNITVSTRSNN